MELKARGLFSKGQIGDYLHHQLGGPMTFSCPSFHPLAQSQPTVHRTHVELISPGPESGGNCLFLAYDSPRMWWATAEQGEGGRRREEKEKLQGLEGQGGQGSAKPLA